MLWQMATSSQIRIYLVLNLPEEHKLGLSMAFQKDSALTAEFDRVLKELQDNGEVEKLVLKWFSN